jgi:hypothetical protein
MNTRTSLIVIILIFLFSVKLFAQNDLLNEGATIKNNTYKNINSKSWNQILAEDTFQWKPPYTIQMPVQPVHSPDFIHIDCALNAMRRRVFQNISLKDYQETKNHETFIVQFAFDNPPFVPDFNLSKLSLAYNRYPIVTGEYQAMEMLYRIEYSCSPVDENQSLLWMHISVTNIGEKTEQAHVRCKINFQPEKDLLFFDYVPYYWDASKWLPCDRVKLQNNSIIRDDRVIGKIVSESMNVTWENETNFSDDDFYNKFGMDHKWTIQNMRLKNIQDVIHAKGELKPGEGKTFSIALLTNDNNITGSQLSYLEMCSARECREKAMEHFKSQFTRENTEMIFPAGHWQDIFTELQISTLQLLVKFPDKESLMPTQGGNDARCLVWVWEAGDMLRPMLRTGHFDVVRKSLDYIFSLQDAGVPPEGKFTTTKGAIGTTGPKWICSTGAALSLACDYYKYSKDKAFLEQYLPKIIKASRWIVGELRATRKLNPDGSRPLYYGLLPFGVATDGDIGYVVAFSDAYTFLGLQKTTKLLEDINHSYARELGSEVELYRSDLTVAIRGLSHPDGSIDRAIITNEKGTSNWKEVERLCSSANFAYTGVIKAESELFQRFISFVENNWSVDYFMGNFTGEGNMSRDVAYMTAPEYIWQHIYLSTGQWKKAYAALRTDLKYGMTQDTYQVLERYSRNNPAFTPWQPNGSGNGRIMDMMLNSFYFETDQGVTLLGGIPFAWLQQNKKTSLRKLYTTNGYVNLEIMAINPETCTVCLSSSNSKALPSNIRFPEYLHAIAKSPSVINTGDGLFKVKNQVDEIVFDISGD